MDVMKKVEKTSENIKFKYVKKTGSSIRNMLVKSKRASLGNPDGNSLTIVFLVDSFSQFL